MKLFDLILQFSDILLLLSNKLVFSLDDITSTVLGEFLALFAIVPGLIDSIFHIDTMLGDTLVVLELDSFILIHQHLQLFVFQLDSLAELGYLLLHLLGQRLFLRVVFFL
jgi:hypothetical protein